MAFPQFWMCSWDIVSNLDLISQPFYQKKMNCNTFEQHYVLRIGIFDGSDYSFFFKQQVIVSKLINNLRRYLVYYI